MEEIEGFEWDEGNSLKNWFKHKVRMQEAEETLLSEPDILLDKLHSTVKEKRYLARGRTARGRKLFIVFTIRGKYIRVISARDQHKKERSDYDKAT